MDASSSLRNVPILGRIRARSQLRLKSGEWLVALLFLLPALLHFALFKFYPVAYSFALSLYRGRLLDPFDRFMGAYHYSFLLRDSYFWQGVVNAFVYTIARVSRRRGDCAGAGAVANAELSGAALFSGGLVRARGDFVGGADSDFCLALPPRIRRAQLHPGAVWLCPPAMDGATRTRRSSR